MPGRPPRNPTLAFVLQLPQQPEHTTNISATLPTRPSELMAALAQLRTQDQNYAAGRRLGSGATGAVYEGRRLKDMAPVALKIVSITP